jgi:hypothetical protein
LRGVKARRARRFNAPSGQGDGMVLNTLTFGGGLMLGLASSLHCAGMCSAIASPGSNDPGLASAAALVLTARPTRRHAI